MALCYIYIFLFMFSDIPMCGACVLVYHDTSQHGDSVKRSEDQEGWSL